MGGDTLTWDGNTQGLKNYSDTTQFWKCRISDVTPTLDQLKNGVTVVQKSCDGKTREEIFEPFDAIEYYEYSHSAHGNGYQIQFEEYRQSNGIVIEKGIYFFNDGEREIYTAELKIPNFTGFPKEQVKQEYLPSVGEKVAKIYLDKQHEILSCNVTYEEFVKAYDNNSPLNIIVMVKEDDSIDYFTPDSTIYIVGSTYQVLFDETYYSIMFESDGRIWVNEIG